MRKTTLWGISGKVPDQQSLLQQIDMETKLPEKHR
jgi:hypothetical protein